MKRKLRSFVVMLLAGVMTLSCERSIESGRETDVLAQNVLASEKFHRFGFTAEDVDLSRSEVAVSQAGVKIMFIPVKNQVTYTRIVARFDENQQVTGIMQSQFRIRNLTRAQNRPGRTQDEGEILPVPVDEGETDYYNQMYVSDQFTGEVIIDNAWDDPNDTGYRVILSFQNSQLVNHWGGYVGSGTSRCGPWTSDGGPLGCAGTTLVNTPLPSKIGCYLSFLPCMIYNVLDCLWTGCA